MCKDGVGHYTRAQAQIIGQLLFAVVTSSVCNQDPDSTPTPKRLLIFHLVLGVRSESLLKKPGSH